MSAAVFFKMSEIDMNDNGSVAYPRVDKRLGHPLVPPELLVHAPP